jgi:hypothetical protein
MILPTAPGRSTQAAGQRANQTADATAAQTSSGKTTTDDRRLL